MLMTNVCDKCMRKMHATNACDKNKILVTDKAVCHQHQISLNCDLLV